MNNVLVVLVLLAAALGVYWLATGETETTPTGGGGSGRRVAPLGAQAPVLPEGGGRGPLGPGSHVILPPKAMEAAARMREFSWKDTVTTDTLIRMEDAWDVDLSGVDFDADVLCTVGGTEITQADFRRRMLIEHGQLLVRSRWIHMMGQRIAEARNEPFGLSDAEWERYLEVYAEGRGLDVEQGKVLLSLHSKLPVEGALKARRETLEGILALFAPAEFADQLPAELVDTLPDEHVVEQVMLLSGLLSESRGFLEDEDKSRKFSNSLELMILFAQDALEEELFWRTWTSLDAEVPEGAVAAYVGGEIPVDEQGERVVLPPWALHGEPLYLQTDDLFPLLGAPLGRDAQEETLRNLIWSVGQRQTVEGGGGQLPSPESAWLEYADEYIASRGTLLASNYFIQAEGYLATELYREGRSLLAGFESLQPLDWASEENLRAHFPEHRFFIQRWEPDLSVALFPPLASADASADDSAWDQARAEAEDFLARVTADPESFDDELRAHSLALAERYRQQVGQEAAEEFASEFQLGRLNKNIASLHQLLRETESERDRRAASMLDNAVVRLDRGEISPVWRSPVGYVVVRLNNARLARLEDEFEDLVDVTRLHHQRTMYRQWVNEALSAIEVTVP